MNQEKEVGRKELFTGSGIYEVTTERVAWKVICSGLCGFGCGEIGPYDTEEEAQAASATEVGSLVAQYKHRSAHFERNGERVPEKREMVNRPKEQPKEPVRKDEDAIIEKLQPFIEAGLISIIDFD
jgi:hypothetical protein